MRRVNHPAVWKFIDGLRNVQTSKDLYLEQLVAGHTSRRKLLKLLKGDERILKIVHHFHEMDPLECKRDLAHNYDLHS